MRVRAPLGIALLSLCTLLLCRAAVAEQPHADERDSLRKQFDLLRNYLTRDTVSQPYDAYPGERAGLGTIETEFLKRLPSLSDRDGLRIEAIDLARRYARASDLTRAYGLGDWFDTSYHWQSHWRLGFAWRVLRVTCILQDGMGLQELVTILGEPTEAARESVAWCYESPMHINPCLLYWRDGGRVEIISR